ncbi:MAG: transporter substrate-binding domain-containing protein [Alteromonadaceae bacterium]|nr:transporter substrate-binding domain-containing protein [Alteromonadaceae bacterium]
MAHIVRIASYCLLLIFNHGVVYAQPSAPDAATHSTINFAINSPGSAPYLYFSQSSRQYEGVLVDLFNSFAEQENYVVNFQDSSRARSEMLVKQGKSDLFMSGRVWLDDPESFIYSDTLMMHASYIYATTAFDGPFVPEAHPKATVCTRTGFIYPVLQPYFDDKSSGLIRVNSSSQSTMAMMLAKNRCQFTIMSEQNALSILTHSRFCNTEFYQSPTVISQVDLVLVIRKERPDIQHVINKYFAEFKRSGQLQASMARHSGDKGFPKLKCE